jgi:hypothetical protein
MDYARAAAVLLMAASLPIANIAASSPKKRPDLADVAVGSYSGEVISDARGSSRSDVHIIVVKVAPSTIKVSSDYLRLPSFTAKLTRAMHTIQKVDGPEVFLLDLSKSPPGLDVTVDDASWSGVKDLPNH